MVAPGDVAAQTERILDRYRETLSKQGMGLENLAFVTIFLKSLDDYAAMNEVYGRKMPQPYPARKVIQAAMTVEGMVVEMTAVAPRTVKKAIV